MFVGHLGVPDLSVLRYFVTVKVVFIAHSCHFRLLNRVSRQCLYIRRYWLWR